MKHDWRWMGMGWLLAGAACGGDDTSSGVSMELEPLVGGEAAADPVARGEYLVLTVSSCTLCHTPGAAQGTPDDGRLLAGVDCFIDVIPQDDNVGCINPANLTNHETGLANRSDNEIKSMFLRGERPNGEALHPFMPFWSYANMSDSDADAIVAYLRTVPGVNHQVRPHQAPFVRPDEPAAPVALDSIPPVRAGASQYDAAVRGRYLAARAGVCLQCHTLEDRATGLPIDVANAFQGGTAFEAASLGLPIPPFPQTIFSANITPSPEFGIGGWTASDIVAALKQGVRPDGSRLCPPMPSGPSGSLAGLTDQDASDIAAYLLSLPPSSNSVPACRL